ncbi:glycosyl hydrolase family 17 family protein [Hibiscus syriacus]|uniref:Glycosyl hydrolase family 17 family protein n=2 Tax=Hibiscus syriacus TaxID=106335 RepID=A0A6A2ZT76_HIBSY|nr:glycosyl hydrolase family 17 family protein [Hibiscus syriacus]
MEVTCVRHDYKVGRVSRVLVKTSAPPVRFKSFIFCFKDRNFAGKQTTPEITFWVKLKTEKGTMPSKLKRAIGAVKDHTSISLAKVVNTNSATLEVAVLKATTHDQSPIHERHVDEILKTVSSNRTFAGIAARSIAKRLGKTKSWVVALKCLMLVLRVFQDGDPYFPKEVLHALNRKARILNRDESSSGPCDFAAFVKAFAAYLEERLGCFLTGKLQRRFTFMDKQISHPRSCRVNQQPVRHMKPPMLLDRISYWQRLLEKAIATKPTGSAKTNRLVLMSFYAVVRESFDLYRDISNGLGLVLDGFFYLQHQSCISTIEYCVKARKQFEDLSCFYENCKRLAVGRTSDYPSVHGISEELLETLKEFVKDQASFPCPKSPHLVHLLSTAAKDLSVSEREPETGPRISTSSTTLEDLMKHQAQSFGAIRASFSVENFSELSRKQFHEQEQESYNNVAETGSNHSLPIDQEQNVNIDFISFDEWPTVDHNNAQIQKITETSSFSSKGEHVCWELALIEAHAASQNDQSFIDNWTQQASQNGTSGVSFSNNWFQEDHQASQNGAMGDSYMNDWLLQHHHHLQHEQASNDVANSHSCFDDWLKEDNNQLVVPNGNACFGDWLQGNEVIKAGKQNQNWNNNGGNDNWELVLIEAAATQASQPLFNGIEPSMANHLPIAPQLQYNPFLEDETDISASTAHDNVAGFPDGFSMVPTIFQATPPTFFAQSSNQIPAPMFQGIPTKAFGEGESNNPYAPWPTTSRSLDQQNIFLQHLWLQ